jgi:tetratricopeptide (TPR) repeat protein
MQKPRFCRSVGRLLVFFLALAVFGLGTGQTVFAHGQNHLNSGTAPSSNVPLLEGLFALDFPISTTDKKAQEYFNQALVLTYGFDHSDAEVSFLKAAEFDPRAAMPYWGVAFVLGPNINAPMNEADVPRAYAMAQKALGLADRTTDKERALIEALAVRYAPEPVPDRTFLDQAFANAMAQVYDRFPDDPDVAVLYAESLMDLHPWNYWTDDDRPQPWTPAIEAVLEEVVRKHPSHPHGHHLYIHLMENSPMPEAAIKSADLIRNLAPASGHLVHMAGHAYYAAGLYHDCSVINEKAIGVDKVLRTSFDSDGLYQLAYMPHNLHFLLASYMMEGRSAEALAVARKLSAGVDPHTMRQPGLGALQQFYLTPFYTLVRFGHWEEILDLPAPAADLKYPSGMWHYARGMAFIRLGDSANAAKELAMVRQLAADPAVVAVSIWDMNSGSSILDIAVQVLSGEIAAADGKTDKALSHFERGVELEESLSFDEPPSWYYPVRQSLGTLLLDLKRYEEAEKIFRKDLLKNAENPWSLFGLALSLKAQGKTQQADDAEKRFRRAWSRADIELDRPVF